MNKNYHTHTKRCKHAFGEMEDYVLTAIKEGFTVLGFSDHSPWHYDNYHPTMRMEEDEFPDYINECLMLKEKYKNQIDIKIGLEVEYFENKWSFMENLVKSYPLDYLILGQHFHQTDEYGDYYGRPLQPLNKVKMYVEEVLKALDTNLISYIAHPDVIRYDKNDLESIKELEKICIKAKEKNIPLEFNLLGYHTNRHYPSKEFLELCKKHHNQIILGVDAHKPSALRCQLLADKITNQLKQEGLEIIDEINYLKGE